MPQNKLLFTLSVIFFSTSLVVYVVQNINSFTLQAILGFTAILFAIGLLLASNQKKLKMAIKILKSSKNPSLNKEKDINNTLTLKQNYKLASPKNKSRFPSSGFKPSLSGNFKEEDLQKRIGLKTANTNFDKIDFFLSKNLTNNAAKITKEN